MKNVSTMSERPVGGSRAAPARVTGLADQAMFSIVNFGELAIYARLLQPHDLGNFAILISVCAIAQSIQRASIVMPMLISGPASEIDFRSWGRLSISLASILALGLLAAGGLIRLVSERSEWHWLFWSAFAIPPYLLYEFNRRRYFVSRDYRAVLISSAGWVSCHAIGLTLVWKLGPNFNTAALAFVFSCSIAALNARLLRPLTGLGGHKSMIELVRSSVSLIAWNNAALVPYTVFNNAMPMIISALIGASGVAVYSATRIIVAPITVLVSAVDSVDKPRAARALLSGGSVALSKSLVRTGYTLLLLLAPYMLLAIVAREPLVRLVVGPRYVAHADVVLTWLLVGVMMSIAQPIETGLVVLRKSNLYFWSRLAGAIGCVSVLAIGSILPGSPVAHTVWAVLAAWSISGALGAMILVHSMEFGARARL